MVSLFNAIGGVMSSVLNALIGVLPLGTDEEKETWKTAITTNPALVGFISLFAMIIACFLAPMLGLDKVNPFKKKRRRRKRRTTRRRK